MATNQNNENKCRNIPEIPNKKAIDDALNVLNERISPQRKWFYYDTQIINCSRKYRITYNNIPLDLNFKDWNSLIKVMKMLSKILSDYKTRWYDKNKHKFYAKADMIFNDETNLKMENNWYLPDLCVMDWEAISKEMWSNLDINNTEDYASVRNKKRVNTQKLAEFLNVILQSQ